MKIRATETSNRQEIWNANDHIGDLVWNPVINEWELDCTSLDEMLGLNSLTDLVKILKAKNSIVRGSVHG